MDREILLKQTISRYTHLVIRDYPLGNCRHTEGACIPLQEEVDLTVRVHTRYGR